VCSAMLAGGVDGVVDEGEEGEAGHVTSKGIGSGNGRDGGD
jgi:hypothetical protein